MIVLGRSAWEFFKDRMKKKGGMVEKRAAAEDISVLTAGPRGYAGLRG